MLENKRDRNMHVCLSVPGKMISLLFCDNLVLFFSRMVVNSTENV